MATSYTVTDYLNLPRPEEVFVVDELLPRSGALLIYGDPKAGKSFAALQLAQAVATGTPWYSFPTHRGSVLYVQLDTPRGLWVERLEDLRESGESIEQAAIHLADRESFGTWPFNILNPDHYQILASTVARLAPDVVIIDTLKESHQLPENDNTDSQRVLAALVSATQPAALVIVHHGKKLMEGRPNDLISGARGASYLTGRMDAVVHFSSRMMKYVSRAAEGGELKLERKDNGYWELSTEGGEMADWLDRVLNDPTTSLREKARQLAELSGRSMEACRSILRRHDRHPTTDARVQAEARRGRGGSR